MPVDPGPRRRPAHPELAEAVVAVPGREEKWSCEDGGYWYVANAGDCDGGDTINFWFEGDANENGYVEELDARI